MERRELLKMISSITGMTLIGLPGMASGYGMVPVPPANNAFSESEVATLDEIAETILPRTSTPGAKDAGVGLFMAQFVTDCYTPEQHADFRAGLAAIDSRAGGSFVALDSNARTQLLTELDIEAKAQAANQDNQGKAHYFTMFKQLSIFSFFTSKVGATEVLRYAEVPGYYDGNVDYVPGTPAWAIGIVE